MRVCVCVALISSERYLEPTDLFTLKKWKVQLVSYIATSYVLPE